MSSEPKGSESMSERLFDALSALNQTIVQRQNQVDIIARDYPEEKLRTDDYNLRKQRLAVVNQHFDKTWIAALEALDALCRKIRQRQPHLNALTEGQINNSGHFPDALVFGRLHLCYQNWQGYVPRLLPFPFKKPLWLPNSSEGRGRVHQLLLRLLHSLPMGNVEVIAADPLKLGTSLKPFLSLLQVKPLFPNQRMLTRTDELENALARLTDYVEDLLQNRFNGDVNNWAAWNAAHRAQPLSYKLLLLFDVPEQLTDKSLWYLGRLLEHGPACGVLPILIVDETRLSDRKFSGLSEAITTGAARMDAIISAQVLHTHVSEIAVAEEQEFWPTRAELAPFLLQIATHYQQHSRFNKQLTELWQASDYWQNDAVQGIAAPIGWTEDGESVPLALGGIHTEHHVLLAGRSGSGKSNLLHVLIHSLCHRYSPAELSVYLLDYKQGTEFNIYASPALPQARLVATESDPEYGVTVLAHLTAELEKRASEFKRHGARDYYEYRAVALANLPRILLIIDEFQILFSEGRQVAEPAEKMLTQLLRQGRAYGIHVLLATQTLKGIQSLSIGQLISQIGCRIALACSEEDSAMILGNSNWEASTLSGPPEGIINNANGAKSANQRFFIPGAEQSLCKQHISRIVDVAAKQGFRNRTTVFNGSHLPVMPEKAAFKATSTDVIQLHLGECLSFEAEPLVVTLARRPATNLLVAGYNDTLHDGLLTAVLCSLQGQQDIDEIIYFDARAGATVLRFDSCTGDIPLLKPESVEVINLHELSETLPDRKRVLVIDGLESAKAFHSGPANFRSVKKDEPPSAVESLKRILEEGSSQGTFVIAFAENWKRCNASCKELLSLFELRIGFCMNEDDAGAFLSGTIGKFKGLESENRAVFADRLKNHSGWFRPYIARESE
ncbi:FtsK/SpoIIIE domain-containing protein [Yersinia enterocolitica]